MVNIKQIELILFIIIKIVGSSGSSIEKPENVNSEWFLQIIDSTINNYREKFNQQNNYHNQIHSNLMNNLISSVNEVRSKINSLINPLHVNLTMIQSTDNQHLINLRHKVNQMGNEIRNNVNQQLTNCLKNEMVKGGDLNLINVKFDSIRSEIDLLIGKIYETINGKQDEWKNLFDLMRFNLNLNFDEMNNIINSHSDKLISTLNQWKSMEIIKRNHLIEIFNDKVNLIRNSMNSQLIVDQLIKSLNEEINATMEMINDEINSQSNEIKSFFMKKLTNDDNLSQIWSQFYLEDVHFFSSSFIQSIQQLTNSITNDINCLSYEIKNICTI